MLSANIADNRKEVDIWFWGDRKYREIEKKEDIAKLSPSPNPAKLG